MYKASLTIFLLNKFVWLCAGQNFVINTWGGPFSAATSSAFATLQAGGNALDAIEQGCMTCQDKQCDGTVGYGNHPDTQGHSSLDAMIMDGDSFDIGSVAYLRRHRQAISIARAVMHYTGHTLLVGEGAEDFADMMGFPQQSVTTNSSYKEYLQWVADDCQPNFYENIAQAQTACGPYNLSTTPNATPMTADYHEKYTQKLWKAHRFNHDTIGIVAGRDGAFACGTSTNGANHKIAGRVGDSPIPGAGCYVDSSAGGAAATGDGDVMMRFMPSFAAVQYLKQGLSVQQACQKALDNIAEKFADFSGGMVCIDKEGGHAGVAYNMGFAYSFMKDGMSDVEVIQVA